MHTISRDAPGYYLTSVVQRRLQLFVSDNLNTVVCNALNEARRSGKFALYAYVIMPDHLHVVVDSALSPAETLRFINGITGRRVIDHLKSLRAHDLLKRLEHAVRERDYRYSLWDHHPNKRLLWSEEMLMERVHYTHRNPVRAGLVERADDYRWSSIRCWNRNPLEDEPLLMDLSKIRWRRS